MKKYFRKDSKKPIKLVKRTKTKKITMEGQAPDIKVLISKYAQGFPLPMAREEMIFPEDLNELLEDRFDLPNPERYAAMDINERAKLNENIRQLQSEIKDGISQRQAAYEAALKAKEREEIKAELQEEAEQAKETETK